MQLQYAVINKVDDPLCPPSFLGISQVGRRRAEEAKRAYEKNSRRAEESLKIQNADMRIVAEEKEKYRQRQM